MRKLRTRQHVIEDLSYNFVEKQVLLGFCTFERYTMRQYSYDEHVFTFDETGQTEDGIFFIQVKATDHLRFSKQKNGYMEEKIFLRNWKLLSINKTRFAGYIVHHWVNLNRDCPFSKNCENYILAISL